MGSPAGRTASVDTCVSSFESGLEGEDASSCERRESRFEPNDLAESVRPMANS